MLNVHANANSFQMRKVAGDTKLLCVPSVGELYSGQRIKPSAADGDDESAAKSSLLRAVESSAVARSGTASESGSTDMTAADDCCCCCNAAAMRVRVHCATAVLQCE